MIGKLRGVVDAIGADEAVIDVAGVGYLVALGAQALGRLQPGAEVVLHIETHVREDQLKLYGFLSERERAWFVRLQLVQGVGAKHALGVIDALGASDLETAAALGDASAFSRAKGVGTKLAQRLALELKDKAPPLGRSFAADFAHPSPGGAKPAATPAQDTGSAAREDAVSALINLGYGESDARRAAASASRALGPDANEGALIRQALKELAR